MDSNGFTASTMFYRETLTEYLTPVDGGAYRISANEDPSEAVIDVYSQGHMTLAQHVGAGLAFTVSPENQWRASDRTTVAVRLGDVLDQGGLIYPVESVITDEVWYFTLPDGGVEVNEPE